ncbi:MAG: hypothetical protein IT561_18615 [Alphaproteobacteria bacterium]|nr:hypothetical protein [Alphaproteobacteria bacterium]
MARRTRRAAVAGALLAASGAAAQVPAPLMAPLPAGPPPARTSPQPPPPGILMAPLPATPPAAAGPLMAPLAPAPPAARPAPPPARPAAPAGFANRELPDGAVQVAPLRFAAEIEREGTAYMRRYVGRVLQVEAIVDRRPGVGDRLPTLRLRAEIPGSSLKVTVSCVLQDDVVMRLLVETLQPDRPAAVAGIVRDDEAWSTIWRDLSLGDCIVLDGHPDPAPLRALLVEEAEIQWKRDANARRRQ